LRIGAQKLPDCEYPDGHAPTFGCGSACAHADAAAETAAQCEKQGYIQLKRGGYELHEVSCRYVSIRHTGQTMPAHTKPSRKEHWIPVIHVKAQCSGIDQKWTEELKFSYNKSVLGISDRKILGRAS